ncbi:restriction endonuclease subunit M [Sphingobium ummariense RL-3]|uniref:site-specific DNA-methyltransferase (adenine-specific) n=2 Tax=Sphingobium TaxID=165695 RepID=T0KEU1_9SPHN|nr:restriction endonuclease subunit M [Sphingobium ummariense RL-3]
MLTPVGPVRPVASYIGGKRALAKTLVPMIAAVPHQCYVEPFVGMGGIFFRRDRRPKAEIINDISADVTNLFRLLQRHYQQLLDVLKWQVTSRADFDRLVRVEPDTLTELERAARFLFLQRMAFGGKVMGRNFGTKTTGPAMFDLTKLVPMLEDVHERLAGVVIERLPYERLIPRYDRADTLFYLDPPYWGCTDDYGLGVFSEADFERLSGLLKRARGSFILSINDVPEVREIFSWASIEPVNLNYRVSGRVTAARELIISSPRQIGR